MAVVPVVRLLSASDVELVRLIDRAEHVEVEYEMVDGRLRERPLTVSEIPEWETSGDGPHSFEFELRFCREALEDGGLLLGGYVGGEFAGLAVVQPAYEPPLARLTFLHVSRSFRRTGVGTRLWADAVERCRAASAERMYVSATPTGSAVGFYLRQGCTLAIPPHPTLVALEPDDIHLALAL